MNKPLKMNIEIDTKNLSKELKQVKKQQGTCYSYLESKLKQQNAEIKRLKRELKDTKTSLKFSDGLIEAQNFACSTFIKANEKYKKRIVQLENQITSQHRSKKG